jgi:hypothetical protein
MFPTVDNRLVLQRLAPHSMRGAYRWTTPDLPLNVANRPWLELWNGYGSKVVLRIQSIRPVQVTGVDLTSGLVARFDLYRTSALASGGEPFVSEGGAAAAGGAVNPLDTQMPVLPAAVKGVFTPNGTSGTSTWLRAFYVPATNFNSNKHGWQALEVGLPLVLREGQGIRIEQATAPTTLHRYQFRINFAAY